MRKRRITLIEATLVGKEPVMTIDKPDFIVRLYEDWIDVDLKEGFKERLENVIEKNPALRKTLGFALQTVIPSDVELCEIESVKVDNKGHLKLVIPRHVDIVLPLEMDEAQRLAEKLNELIPFAKTKKKAFRKRIPLYLWWPSLPFPVKEGL
jgi:hypothetical protein